MLTIVSMKGILLQELEKYRIREGLSVRALAIRLRVSDSYLSMVLSGSRKVGMPLLRGIARITLVDLEAFLAERLRNGHDTH